MTEKVNISQVMNQCQIVTDADYVFVEEGNSQGKIKKENLVHISPKLGFNGDFKDPANFPKAGLYIYEVNTSSSGTFNGPDGDKTFYGTVEIIFRMDENSNGLNIVTIKAYSYDITGFMLIGRKKLEKIRMAGENGNKYIDIIKPVLTEMAGTGRRLSKK